MPVIPDTQEDHSPKLAQANMGDPSFCKREAKKGGEGMSAKPGVQTPVLKTENARVTQLRPGRGAG
jgi:hypothetical protein